MALPIAVPIAIAAAGALAQIGGAYMNYKASDRARKAAEAGAGRAADTVAQSYGSMSKVYDQNASDLNNFQGKIDSIYDTDTLKSASARYKALLDEDTGNHLYTPGEFGYDKTIESFYDPAYKVNMQAQLDALDNSASSAGHLYSSGLRQQGQGLASALATRAYKEARDAYFRDKGLEADIWGTEERNKQAAAESARSRYKTLMDSYGGFTKKYFDINSDLLSAQINNRNQSAAAYQNAVNAYAQQVANANGNETYDMPYYRFNNGTSNLGVKPV